MLIREPEFGLMGSAQPARVGAEPRKYRHSENTGKTQLLGGLGCHALFPHTAWTLPPEAVCAPREGTLSACPHVLEAGAQSIC